MTADSLRLDDCQNAVLRAPCEFDAFAKHVCWHNNAHHNDFQRFSIDPRWSLETVACATENSIDYFVVGKSIHEELLRREWFDQSFVGHSHHYSPRLLAQIARGKTLQRGTANTQVKSSSTRKPTGFLATVEHNSKQFEGVPCGGTLHGFDPFNPRASLHFGAST